MKYTLYVCHSHKKKPKFFKVYILLAELLIYENFITCINTKCEKFIFHGIIIFKALSSFKEIKTMLAKTATLYYKINILIFFFQKLNERTKKETSIKFYKHVLNITTAR